MADKRVNPLLIGGVGLAVTVLSLTMCSGNRDRHQPMTQLPHYDANAKRLDGDTQTDTIKALQAYAREAVKKADALHASTEDRLQQVQEQQHQLSTLVRANTQAEQMLDDTRSTVESLEQRLARVQQELAELRGSQPALNDAGLPIGFGFDDAPVSNSDSGEWVNPVDWVAPDSGAVPSARFSGLLSPPSHAQSAEPDAAGSSHGRSPTPTAQPVYTIPKDSTLTDAVALTALIGRIPVQGQTRDPYPVKIFVGRETLLANGHELPEIEGMIFSGLGIGDWNLSCVSARLMSATFIFQDGSIVNHSADGEPLGYLSDPAGVPCIAGRFVTNAVAFLSQRIGLSALGAAGAAYAQAQRQQQTSALTGTTTDSVVGDLDKLAAGDAVDSATREVNQWLLARQQQSFDAVVVNPGAPVAVHLNQTLSLDLDSLQRKVRYAQTSHTAVSDLD